MNFHETLCFSMVAPGTIVILLDELMQKVCQSFASMFVAAFPMTYHPVNMYIRAWYEGERPVVLRFHGLQLVFCSAMGVSWRAVPRRVRVCSVGACGWIRCFQSSASSELALETLYRPLNKYQKANIKNALALYHPWTFDWNP